MPVFISYSHEDRGFATDLAKQLVKHKASVWLDQWELRVGDSLLEKIQSAIKSASALIVVLSRASVASEWCKKELNAGLIRELEERRVLVLPVLLEDCDIPMFLREKKWADFRRNYDDGLGDVLTAVAAFTSDSQGRIEEPEYHVDWSMDWGFLDDGHYYLRFTFVDHAPAQPYTVLTQVMTICNDVLTRRFQEHVRRGNELLARLMIAFLLNRAIHENKVQPFVLDDSLPKKKTINYSDVKGGHGFEAVVESRRMGADTGLSTLVRWTNHLEIALEQVAAEATGGNRERLAQLKRLVEAGEI